MGDERQSQWMKSRLVLCLELCFVFNYALFCVWFFFWNYAFYYYAFMYGLFCVLFAINEGFFKLIFVLMLKCF